MKHQRECKREWNRTAPEPAWNKNHASLITIYILGEYLFQCVDLLLHFFILSSSVTRWRKAAVNVQGGCVMWFSIGGWALGGVIRARLAVGGRRISEQSRTQSLSFLGVGRRHRTSWDMSRQYDMINPYLSMVNSRNERSSVMNFEKRLEVSSRGSSSLILTIPLANLFHIIR